MQYSHSKGGAGEASLCYDYSNMTSVKKHIVVDARIRRSSTGRYTDRLLQHLQAIDHYHTYTVLLMPDDTWQPTAKNFSVAPCPFAQFSFNLLDQIRFTQLLKRLKPDLVHFTMTQQPVLYFGKIVTTTHDLTMFNFVRAGQTTNAVFQLKKLGYRFLFWWSHKKSDYIIVPTQFVANDLAQFQPAVKDKVVVTYESSEPPLKQKSVKPRGVNVGSDFIMYVGSAFPHKNLETLLDAFDILHREHPTLKLVLVGKKEYYYEELEQVASTHSSYKNIIFTGYLPDEELKWLYEHCKAYVFASLSEGFGLPPLEAMAHDLPVISSNASCMPEVYGDAAYYFNPHKPKDIAAKVTDVLTDKKLREKLVKSGRERLKKYSWRTMAEETLTIYKSALDETTE